MNKPQIELQQIRFRPDHGERTLYFDYMVSVHYDGDVNKLMKKTREALMNRVLRDIDLSMKEEMKRYKKSLKEHKKRIKK